MHFLGPLVATTILVPAQTPAQRKIQEIRSVLAQEVDFPGFDDPKMTFEDALSSLGKRYHLTIRVNDAAFADDDTSPSVLKILVLKTPLRRVGQFLPGLYPIVARKGDQLDAVLREILARVPTPFDAGPYNPVTGLPLDPFGVTCRAVYVVWPNGIEVTTTKACREHSLLPEPPSPPTPAQLKRVRDIGAALAQDVDFPGFKDPRTTLGQALKFLGERYRLTFSINEPAFNYEEFREVLKTPIADPNPIRARKDYPLHLILRSVLERVPVPSGAAFVIRSNGIEVTTTKFLKAEMEVPPQQRPTPHQSKRARELRDSLIRPSQFSGFYDPRMTLEEALDFMTTRYGLRFWVNQRAFNDDNTEEVLRTPIADPNPIPRSVDLILPGKVLEALLTKVPTPAEATFVIRPHGYVEITTKRFLLAELQGPDPRDVAQPDQEPRAK